MIGVFPVGKFTNRDVSKGWPCCYLQLEFAARMRLGLKVGPITLGLTAGRASLRVQAATKIFLTGEFTYRDISKVMSRDRVKLYPSLARPTYLNI